MTERRRTWQDKAQDLWESSLFKIMRMLPTEQSSNFGSFVIRNNVRLNRPQIIAGARRNLKLLRPDLSEAEVEAAIWRFLDNVGRFMAEFAVMHRMLPEGRVEIHGLDALTARYGHAPTVALPLHTGNWEVFGVAFQQAGLPFATFYEIPDSLFQQRVVEEARRALGFRLLAPDSRGLRDALSILQKNGTVGIFGDEARAGVTMAPLFGRPPHSRGNLAIAARLARKSGAGIVIGHCERIGTCHFRLNHAPAVNLPPVSGKPDVVADVAFLNERIEPIIRANLDRWYYLDDALDVIGD